MSKVLQFVDEMRDFDEDAYFDLLVRMKELKQRRKSWNFPVAKDRDEIVKEEQEEQEPRDAKDI